MNLNPNERTLAARALKVFAAQQRRSAPQPNSDQARKLYSTIMRRAVEADRLAEKMDTA